MTDNIFLKIKEIETNIEIKKIKKELEDYRFAFNSTNDISIIETLFYSTLFNFFSRFPAMINQISNFEELSVLPLTSSFYNIVINDLKKSSNSLTKKSKNKKIHGNNPFTVINNDKYAAENLYTDLIVKLEQGKYFIDNFPWKNSDKDSLKHEKISKLYSIIYFFIETVLELLSAQSGFSIDELGDMNGFLKELDSINNAIDDLFISIKEYRYNQSLLADYTNLLSVILIEKKRA